jgi:hypothetical protein
MRSPSVRLRNVPSTERVPKGSIAFRTASGAFYVWTLQEATDIMHVLQDWDAARGVKVETDAAPAPVPA